MKRAFVELGISYIPSRLLDNILLDTLNIFKDNFLFTSSVNIYGTNKRIIIDIGEVDSLKRISQEIWGPPCSIAMKDMKLTNVGHKFVEKSGINYKDIEVREKQGKEYLFATKYYDISLEKEIEKSLKIALESIDLEKRMIWGGLSFIRPIRYITSFHGDIELKLKLGEISGSNLVDIRGSKMHIESYDNYFSLLKSGNIVFKKEDRLLKAVQNHSSDVKEVLLNSKTFLRSINDFENPKTVVCKVPSKYMVLPTKIVDITIDKHQNGVMISEDEFVVICEEHNDSNKVREGNLLVVNSRLSDSYNFYNDDIQKEIDFFIKESDKRELLVGTVGDKLLRIYSYCKELSTKNIFDTSYLKVIPMLKFDLESSVVKEKDYQLLRGYMGMIYANNKGIELSNVVFEHYLPRFPGDEMPSSKESAIISVIDKLDNISMASIKKVLPTGAKDPTYLRRDANSAIELIDFMKLDINLLELGEKLLAASDFNKFMRERVENYFYSAFEKSVVKSTSHLWFNIKDIRARCQAISSFDLSTIKELYIRISNILKGQEVDVEVEQNHLLEVEKELLERSKELEQLFKKYSTNYALLLNEVVNIAPLIEKFFEKVIIMSDNIIYRNNRIAILNKIYKLLNYIANFDILINRIGE